jgi:hypothetical protein
MLDGALFWRFAVRRSGALAMRWPASSASRIAFAQADLSVGLPRAASREQVLLALGAYYVVQPSQV